jgi:phosphoenolpyruvate---glycerone phosphotransferase subunit DhaL
MANTVFTLDNIKSVLKLVAADIKGRAEELRELDAVVGDGDLGITIELAANAMSTFLETASVNNIGELLMKCGMNINKASPSTFGTLLAAGFLGAAKASANKKEITADDLSLMGISAIDGIKNRGKADVGDKTMLDSLVPAVDAFKEALKNKTDLSQALDAAVKASEAGMWATVKMQAKHGRASRHQAGTVEIRDGGATAMYYIIDSFAGHMKALS